MSAPRSRASGRKESSSKCGNKPGNKTGYNVAFVPFDRRGTAGAPMVFADGFAAFDPSSPTPGRAQYRPVGAAVGPDGTLYVADSQKGRVWWIAYGAN